MESLTDGFPGVVTPVLSADLLERIYQLNLDYLELLTADGSGSTLGGAPHLPQKVLETLRKTSIATRQSLATTAFTLYSLGFEDQHFWRSALRIHAQPIETRYGASADSMQSAFYELAVMHAWHVAVEHPVAARLLYGMPTVIIDHLARARLWQLRRIAVEFPGLLMPRWPANPCFWPEMIKFAASGDLRRLHTLQQLGHQLIAIDLQTSSDKRSAARERQHNLLRQRLHRSP